MAYLFLTILLAFFQQPADLSTRFSRAVELQQQGKLEEAAQAYRALLKEKPDYFEALANLGVVQARQGRYEDAVASYGAALKLSPQSLPIRLNLGIAYYRAGQFEKAVEIFE